MMFCRGSNWRLLSAIGEGEGGEGALPSNASRDGKQSEVEPPGSLFLFDPERFIAELMADLSDTSSTPSHSSPSLSPSHYHNLISSTQLLLSVCKADKVPVVSSRLSSPVPATNPESDNTKWSFLAFNSPHSLFKQSHQVMLTVILLFTLAAGTATAAAVAGGCWCGVWQEGVHAIRRVSARTDLSARAPRTTAPCLNREPEVVLIRALLVPTKGEDLDDKP
jgi:hypothetical protein